MNHRTPKSKEEQPHILDEFDTYISYPFPLSSGKTARLYLPLSITRKDVARIIKMVEALTFEETPLRSNGERRQTNDQPE